MSDKSNNVRHLETSKQEGQGTGPAAGAPAGGTGRDMSKVALVIALLAVVLVSIFFFGLSSNISGIGTEVQQIERLQDQVDQAQARIAELERLPQRTRALVFSGILEDMAASAAYLGGQLQDQDLANRMADVQEQVRAVQYALQQSMQQAAAQQPAEQPTEQPTELTVQQQATQPDAQPDAQPVASAPAEPAEAAEPASGSSVSAQAPKAAEPASGSSVSAQSPEEGADRDATVQ